MSLQKNPFDAKNERHAGLANRQPNEKVPSARKHVSLNSAWRTLEMKHVTGVKDANQWFL